MYPVYREQSPALPKLTESKRIDYNKRPVEGNSAKAVGRTKLFQFNEIQRDSAPLRE